MSITCSGVSLKKQQKEKANMAKYYAISGCCFGMNKVNISVVELIIRILQLGGVLKDLFCVYCHATNFVLQ